jgi:calcineurin-like phosphoesterase family protein
MKNDSWTTWFWSDMHFGHDAVIDFCNRPFTDKEHMKEELIARHNKVVKPNDLVIYGGDIFFHHTKNQMREVLSRLNGRKILVRGNHDFKPREMMNVGFDLCVESMEMIIANEKVLISHFPYRMNERLYKWLKIKKFFYKILKLRTVHLEKYHDKRPVDRGQFLLHGHTHDTYKVKGRMIHIGVDAWNYTPVNIQEISNIICKVKKDEENNRK